MKVRAEAGRFNVVSCGRRWGKSILGVDLAIDVALDGYPVGWFAPEYKLLRDAWREMVEILGEAGKPNQAERRIELPNGGIIECWAFDRNANAGRSRRYKRVVIDEAAHCRDLATIWTKAIRPTLTDFKGDAWFLSSPNGKNAFYQYFDRGQRRVGKWRAWRQTSYDNPYLDPREIDDARLDLDEWAFRQEYLAEFLDDASGALIPAHWIDRCADAGLAARVAELRAEGQGGRCRLAVDLSVGTGRDRTILCVRDRLGVLDWHESAFTGLAEAALIVARCADEFAVQDEDLIFDAGGPGRDFPRYLEQHRIDATPYHGGAPSKGKYFNRRTRTFWSLRQRLDPDRPLELPPEPENDGNPWRLSLKVKTQLQPPFSVMIGDRWPGLAEELKGLRYEMKGAKIALEDKDDFVARLGRSPDAADCLAMTFYGDD